MKRPLTTSLLLTHPTSASSVGLSKQVGNQILAAIEGLSSSIIESCESSRRAANTAMSDAPVRRRNSLG